MNTTTELDPYVFISYKREESQIARTLKDSLEKTGFNVWWDEDIQCGQVWNDVLDLAVRQAHCIVVLWSEKSMSSRWVMHEASSAMDRQIYAPVRIQLIPINPPYDRYQATDLLDWDGNLDHPGFTSLKHRISELIPEKLSKFQKSLNRLWHNKITILSIVFALSALSLLGWQFYTSRIQLNQLTSVVNEMQEIGDMQESAARDIERAIHPIEEVEAELFIDLIRGNPSIDKYLDRISSKIENALNDDGIYNLNVSIVSTTLDVNERSKPTVISFDLNSELGPSRIDENEIGVLFYQSLYSLSFFKDSINVTEFESPSEMEFEPDLHYLVFTDLEFLWNIEKRELTIRAKTAGDGGIWSRTGRIVSIPDLKRSWFFLKLGDKIASREMIVDGLKPQENLLIKSLSLSMTGGRRFSFGTENLVQHFATDGIGYYSLSPNEWEKAIQGNSY